MNVRMDEERGMDENIYILVFRADKETNEADLTSLDAANPYTDRS